MTAPPSNHEGPSTFALDVYWSSGRAGDDAIARHVAECARCRAYLESLDGIAAEPAPPIDALAPSSAHAHAHAHAPAPVARPRRRAWMAPVAASLALAAGALLYVRGQHPATDDGYVGVKGTPAVQLLVHRDHDTRVWDGRSPVRPGDAVALRVACEGLKRSAVAAPTAAGWTRLSSSACPEQGDTLPFTLRVDDAPGDERLAVVLSQNEMDEEALRRAIAETRRAEDVWVVSFVLPKETRSENDR
jgi:hypothetical protein